MLIMETHYQINITPEFMNVSVGDGQIRGVINAKTRQDFRGCFGKTYLGSRVRKECLVKEVGWRREKDTHTSKKTQH